MNKFVSTLLGLFVLMLFALPLVSAATTTFYHNKTFVSTDSVNNGWGFSFKVNTSTLLVGVQQDPRITATQARLYNNSNYISISTNVTNGLFTFNNITLVAGNTYSIITCSGASSYTRWYGTFSTYPLTVINGTQRSINITDNVGTNGGDCTTVTLTGGFAQILNVQALLLGDLIATNFTVTANDSFTNISLQNVSVQMINATGYKFNFTTTNGVVTTSFQSNYTGSLFNVTVNASDNGGYFNYTFINVNVSQQTQVQANITQAYAQFNAFETLAGQQLSGGTFYVTDGNITVRGTNTTQFNLTAKSYNVTYQQSGYYNMTAPFTFGALTNNTLQNITGVYNTTINVSARLSYGNATVTPFTLTVYNSTYNVYQTYTVNNVIQLNLTTGIQYQFNFSATGYLSNSSYYTPATNASNYTIYVFTTNQVFFNFVDEDTLLPVNSVTWALYGTTYAYNGTTNSTVSYVNLSGLNSDYYQLRYSSPPYTSRSYYFNIPITNASFSNVTVYLVNASRALNMTITVTDQNNKPVNNILVTLLRQYAVTSTTQYIAVEQTKPAIALQGTSPFTADPNVIPYLFRVSDATSGLVYFQGAGTSTNDLQTLYLIANTAGQYAYYIKINPTASPFQASLQLQGLSYVFTNTSNSFSLSVSDPNAVTSNDCLSVIANSTINIGSSCGTGASVVIVVPYTPQNGTSYVASYTANATADSKTYLVAQIVDDRSGYGNSANWGLWGVAFLMLTLVFTAIAFVDKPTIGIMLAGVEFTLFGLASLGGLIGLPSGTSIIVTGTMFIFSVIMAMVMRQ